MPPKELDIGWKHCRAVGKNSRNVFCNYCNKSIHGGVTRLKNHLAGITGDVAGCTSVPKEIRKEMKIYVQAKEKEKQAADLERRRVEKQLMEDARNNESDDDTEEGELRRVVEASQRTYVEDQMYGSSHRFGSGTSAPVGSHSSRLFSRSKSARIPQDVDYVPPIDSSILKKQGRTQVNIGAAMKGIKDVTKHVGRGISKFFYYNHIPHNVANSPYYQTMVDAIANAGPGVKPPTAHELSNKYLEQEVEEIHTHIESHKKYWDEYGCTLMCDGWSTQNRHKIINFLVYSTYGTVFLKSVDASNRINSGDYICQLMDSIVEEIGESRVVQVITDNKANYKSAGNKLMEKRKHLYWTPCAAHCIDLIFSDMAKESDVKNIIAQCQQITSFIYNHNWVLVLMRTETKGRELLRPAITRFATHFIALDSLYKHRDDLRRMITSRVWAENFPKFSYKDKKNGVEVYKMIHGDKFWNDVASIICVLEPLVKVLRMVDSDDKADMGYLYEAMDRANEAIKKNVGRGYRKWWEMIDKRWDKTLHRDIHAAGKCVVL